MFFVFVLEKKNKSEQTYTINPLNQLFYDRTHNKYIIVVDIRNIIDSIYSYIS